MKKTIIASLLMASAIAAQAQRIDINNSSNRTENDFEGWTISTTTQSSFTVESENASTGSITITATIDGIKENKTLKGEWWKDGVNKYSKLVGDGVGVYGHDSNNNTPQLQEGSTGIVLTISGLSAGNHTLLAYHNNPSGYNGPTIDVIVNGSTLLTGVAQTNRAQTPETSGRSYIHFTAEEGKDVVVIYRTVPDPSFDYTQGYNTTSLFINALIFDEADPITMASEPSPAHYDMHAAYTPLAVGGNVTLSWTPATSAVKHHVMVGTESGNLQEMAVVTTTNYLLKEVKASGMTYWRIDEEDAQGNIYTGEEWCFRRRRLAFPDAEGYGRWATGGRDGVVYHVTSLDDDANNPQPGTFRYGITKVTGPRTIVFDVSGVIDLKARLTCSDPYVTIAGQTAPGRGIMFTGNPFGMASEGITRFIRMRVGGGDDWDGKSPNPRTSDGLGMAGNDHSIMDHCSVSWTIDEAFSSRNAKNVTLQRTLISEALNRAGHKNYVESKGVDCEHGYAATIGGDRGSYHHNLLAHCEGRNWSLSGGLDGGGAYAGAHDIFNNVVYNWGNRATDGGTHNGQFVANYYKMGPSTTKKVLLQADLEGTGSGTQEYYVNGNIRENLNGTKTQDAINETYTYKLSGGQQLNWTVFVSKPYFESQAKVETAEAAYRSTLSNVGCNQPSLDNHDERMIRETLNRTTTTVGSRSGKKGLVDKESDAEGFSGLNIVQETRPAGWDTDQDGIPDWYEKATGTDPQVANNNADTDGDEYTDLEEYLEFMANPHFIITPGETATINLKQFFAGFKNPRIYSLAITSTDQPWNQKIQRYNYTLTENGVLTITSAIEQVDDLLLEVHEGDDEESCMYRTIYFCATSDANAQAISNVGSVKATYKTAGDQAIYNLKGQRLASMQKGINIVNRKKVTN